MVDDTFCGGKSRANNNKSCSEKVDTSKFLQILLTTTIIFFLLLTISIVTLELLVPKDAFFKSLKKHGGIGKCVNLFPLPIKNINNVFSQNALITRLYTRQCTIVIFKVLQEVLCRGGIASLANFINELYLM